MISKMFIVLYILVQIYFRLALYLYLAQGIYLLHSLFCLFIPFFRLFFWSCSGVSLRFVAVVCTGNTVMFYTLLLDSSKIAV